MLTNFLNNTTGKGLVAVSLIILLLDPCAYLIGGTSSRMSDEKDYRGMSRQELRSEINVVEEQIKNLELEHFQRKSDIYIERNNKFVTTKVDLYREIQHKEAMAQAKQFAIDEIEYRAITDRLELTIEENESIRNFEKEISKLNSEVGEIRERLKEVSAQKKTFEESVRPRVKSIENSLEQKSRPLYDLRKRLNDIWAEKFKTVSPTTESLPPSKMQVKNPLQTLSGDNPTLNLKDPQEFIRNLLSEWGGKIEDSPFPERFWRMGLDDFSSIKPIEGKKYLNLYRNYEAAVQYYKVGAQLGYETSDPTIYALRTTELAKTPEGRAYLLEMKNLLLENSGAGEFILEIPNEEIFKSTFLEQVRPRPSFHEPLPPEPPQRPPRSKLQVQESDRASSEWHKQKTLDLSRQKKLLKENPDLRGVDRSENLIAEDSVAEELERGFDRQKNQVLDEALKNEPPEVRREVTTKLNDVAEKHTPRAVESCIEQGKKTFNSQTDFVKQKISRGRFFSERYQRGLKNLSESKAPWHGKGFAVLFAVLALWDIVDIYNEEGIGAAVIATAFTAGMFAIIAVTIPLVAASSMLAANIATGGLTLLGIWHLWEKMENWVSGQVDAYYADYIIGDEPWQWRVEIPPAGYRDIKEQIGFFTFTGSPAYGLDRETWHHKFRSLPELLNAVTMYQYRLGLAFGKSISVPPKFSREENLRLATRVIENEWFRKYKKDFDDIKAYMQEERAKLLEKESNLDYLLSKLEDPEPQGDIFYMMITPELPTARDNEIEVKALYAVRALPGDKVNLRTTLKLVNTDIGGGPDPVIGTEKLEYGISEAYKTGVKEETLALTGTGHYELSFEVHLEPRGIDPKPKRIKFFISPDEIDDALPEPVTFQEGDIRSIDPLFTGAKVFKEEELWGAQVYSPIASLDGHHNPPEGIYKGFLIRGFDITQYGEHRWARENYNTWCKSFASKGSSREDTKFKTDPDNLECSVLYSASFTRWIDFKAHYGTQYLLHAMYLYKDTFWIKIWISIEDGDFEDLTERWLEIRNKSKKLIDKRLRETGSLKPETSLSESLVSFGY